MRGKNSLNKIFDLTNRNIVVTGSAGLLGSQYAHILSEAGANVILVDVNFKKNKKLEQTLVRKFKTKAQAYSANLAKKSDVQKLRKNVTADYKKIDGLVNNAAYTTNISRKAAAKFYVPFERLSLDVWEKTLGINLTGVFLCSQEFGKIMSQQKKGVIVNVSSIYGIVGADQRIYGKSKLNLPASYAATKGAIVNLTRYLAAYWQRKNIRVNTLTLGGVFDGSYQNSKFVKSYSEKTILGRMANKDEFNGALLFLLSDASSYMTGANLVVDGGWTAW